MFAKHVGILIGAAVAEQDAYLYEDTLKHGSTLILVRADPV